MSEREPENQHEKEPKERASDREIVDFIIKHIGILQYGLIHTKLPGN